MTRDEPPFREALVKNADNVSVSLSERNPYEVHAELVQRIERLEAVTEQDERLSAQIAENAERIAGLQREAGALLTLLAILLDMKIVHDSGGG